MNEIKKFTGIIWLILGPILIIGMIYRAFEEITKASEKNYQETLLFWAIVIIIFIPIASGLTLFGFYALKNEYETI